MVSCLSSLLTERRGGGNMTDISSKRRIPVSHFGEGPSCERRVYKASRPGSQTQTSYRRQCKCHQLYLCSRCSNWRVLEILSSYYQTFPIAYKCIRQECKCSKRCPGRTLNFFNDQHCIVGVELDSRELIEFESDSTKTENKQVRIKWRSKVRHLDMAVLKVMQVSQRQIGWIGKFRV